jgi:hypothetical protein
VLPAELEHLVAHRGKVGEQVEQRQRRRPAGDGDTQQVQVGLGPRRDRIEHRTRVLGVLRLRQQPQQHSDPTETRVVDPVDERGELGRGGERQSGAAAVLPHRTDQLGVRAVE